MSTHQYPLSQGVEGAGGPSQAAGEDMSASEMSDTATACHSGVQVEQQADSQVNTGRADAEAVRQSHDGAKRRRGSGGRLDTRFDDATLGALRTRAGRLGLAPSTWVRAVVRDALHASRSEELDAAVAAHLLGVESCVQASADARELAAQGGHSLWLFDANLPDGTGAEDYAHQYLNVCIIRLASGIGSIGNSSVINGTEGNDLYTDKFPLPKSLGFIIDAILKTCDLYTVAPSDVTFTDKTSWLNPTATMADNPNLNHDLNYGREA